MPSKYFGIEEYEEFETEPKETADRQIKNRNIMAELHGTLTGRELRFFDLVGELKTNEEICQEMNVAPQTVQNALGSIQEKLDCKGAGNSARVKLIRFVLKFKGKI